MPNNQLTITGGRVVALSPFIVAGIINATPDSFSDGGLYYKPENAVAQCLRLWNDGAGILDLGGESTRPGSEFVTATTEMERLRPVLEALGEIRKLRTSQPTALLQDLLKELFPACQISAVPPQSYLPAAAPYGFMPATAPHESSTTSAELLELRDAAAPHKFMPATAPTGNLPLVSVDTWRASTARAALELGAEIINDISGAVFDPEMPAVLAEFKPGYILGHAPAPPRTMQITPVYSDVCEEIYEFFAERIAALVGAGLPQSHIVLDVGIGFGKNLAHNTALLRQMGRFHKLGCPLCLGVSRKSFFGDLLGLPKGEARDCATQVLSALLGAAGVQIHRVHEVKGTVQALQLACTISGG